MIYVCVNLRAEGFLKYKSRISPETLDFSSHETKRKQSKLINSEYDTIQQDHRS